MNFELKLILFQIISGRTLKYKWQNKNHGRNARMVQIYHNDKLRERKIHRFTHTAKIL